MKLNTIALILTLTLQAQAAQFLGLENSNYRIWNNGQAGQVVLAQEGVVHVELPAGSHLIALEMVEELPTPTATVTPTNAPTTDPTPTVTPTPSNRQLFVGGYDEVAQKNGFELLDSNGNSLTGKVNVLNGITTEADMTVADINGNGKMEVVAAGYTPESGIKVEYRSGNGSLLHAFNAMGTGYNTENYLLTGNMDAEAGKESILVGRAADGSYTMKAFNHAGMEVSSQTLLSSGYIQIDCIFTADLNQDGSDKVVVMARNRRGSVEMKVFDNSRNLTSVTVFGNGYIGNAVAFALDINGDGIQEIATVCRSTQQQAYRLVVLHSDGSMIMKKNILPGKFDLNANFASADVDHDGRDEIIAMGRMSDTKTNVLQVIDDNGNQILAQPVLDPTFDGSNSSLYADLNGDGNLEIVVGGKNSITGTATYQAWKHDGSLTASGSALENGTYTDPAMASFDTNEDGSDELLMVGEVDEGTFGLEIRNALNGEIEFSTTFTSSAASLYCGNLL